MKKLTTEVASLISTPNRCCNMCSFDISQKLHLPEISKDSFEMTKTCRSSQKSLSYVWLARNLSTEEVRRELKPFVQVKRHHTSNGFISRSCVQPALVDTHNPRRNSGFVCKFRRGPATRKSITAQAIFKFGDSMLEVGSEKSDCLGVHT